MAPTLFSLAGPLLLGLLLSGCGPDVILPVVDDTAAISTTPTDSGGGAMTDGLAVAANVSPTISTAVGVVVATTEAVSTVEVTLTAGDEVHSRVVEASASGDFEAVFLGLTASTVYDYSVTASDLTEGGTVETGPDPDHLMPFTVEDLAPDAWHSGVFATAFVASPSTALLFDTDGRFLWWYQSDSVGPITRVRLARDGASILVLAPSMKDESWSERAEVQRVSLLGELLSGVPGEAHHDFVELPDGTISQIRHDDRDVDGETVSGDQIVEVAPDGTERQVWTVWDHLTYSADEQQPFYDWTHANALDYDESDDAYLVSIPTTGSIFKIDRTTGEVVWQLGGEGSSFELDGAGAMPTLQHQFEQVSDGLLVFDNHYQLSASELASRMIEYRLDTDAGTATEVWSYMADPPLWCQGLGDVHRFDDGVTAVVWSTAGQIEQVSPEGEVLWKLSGVTNGGLAYIDWLDGALLGLAEEGGER